MKRTVISTIAAISILCSGCAIHGAKHVKGNPIDESRVANIIDGKTTTTEIVGLFGAPSLTSSAGTEELYIYKYCKTSGSGISIIGVGGTSTQEVCNELTISFDKNTGVVKSHNYKKAFEND